MAKLSVTPIVWTEKSLQNAISIRNYLILNFSSKEVNHFYATLQSFEIAVCTYPTLYPRLLLKKNIRRAVLSKVLSAYYRIHKGQIEVIALLDNRCDIPKWL